MSDDVQQFIAETENAEDLGALPWWMPTKRTPAIVGRVLEYRAIDTEYGRMRGAAVELIGQAVVQDGQRDGPRLADKGERVMIWHKNTVLRNAWTEPSSGGGPPAVGEVVGVKRTGERQGSRGTYPTFLVRVLGRNGAALAQTNGGVPADDTIPDDGSYGDPALPQELDDGLPF
jgi:hypothetical protein